MAANEYHTKNEGKRDARQASKQEEKAKKAKKQLSFPLNTRFQLSFGYCRPPNNAALLAPAHALASGPAVSGRQLRAGPNKSSLSNN